jgi:hypothetical protein
MIVLSQVDALIEWLEDNRTDKFSTIPYVRPKAIEGGYELPEDALIVKGLDELGVSYLRTYDFNGHQFTVDSELFK